MIYRNSDDLHRHIRHLNTDPFATIRHCLLDGVDPGVRVEVASFVTERVFPFSDADLSTWIEDLKEKLEVAVAQLDNPLSLELQRLIDESGL